MMSAPPRARRPARYPKEDSKQIRTPMCFAPNSLGVDCMDADWIVADRAGADLMDANILDSDHLGRSWNRPSLVPGVYPQTPPEGTASRRKKENLVE